MLIKNKINYIYLSIIVFYFISFNYLNFFDNIPKISFSKESLPLVILYFTANFILLVSFFFEEKININKLIFLWLLLIIPYLKFFLNEIDIDNNSDPSRYYTYARQIIELKSLNANPLNPYGYLIDQPLYRYYLIPFIAIFGKLNYFFLFFNLSIYFLLTIKFVEYLKINKKYENYEKLIIFYFLLSSAYIAKNILSVQLEWLCIVFSFIIFFSYVNKKAYILFIFLGLLALQRQNYILVSIFIGIIYTLENFYDAKSTIIKSIFLFILISSFPLIHNILLADSDYKIRYFSLKIGLLFFQNPGTDVETFIQREQSSFLVFIKSLYLHLVDSLPTMKIRLLEFLGIEIRPNYTIYQKVFGLLVSPLGFFLIIYIFFITNRNLNIYLFSLIIINIFPLFVLGDGNWPRFQYLSYHSTILFISIWMYKRANK